MTKRFLVAVVGTLALSGMTLLAQDAKQVDTGKKLFSSKECTKCHQIEGKGNKINILDGVATKVTAADMHKWLTEPAAMEAKLDHKPKVKMSSKIKQLKLNPAEIDALVAYLQTLK